MRLVVAEGLFVVVGDIGVDGDAHVRAVHHQAVRLILGRLQAVPGRQSLLVSLGERRDALGHHFLIPARVAAGLRQHLRVAGVQAQRLLGDIRLGKRFDHELEALLVAFFTEDDRQLLARLQRDLPGLAGERVRAVHPGDAAHAVEHFHVGGGRLNVGQVAPGRRVPLIAGVGLQARLGVGQGGAVVDLGGAPRPHGERRGVDHQPARHGADVGKVAGYVTSHLVKNAVAADDVGAFAGVGLRAPGGDADRELGGQAVHQRIRGARQRPAVEQLAGALGHQGDGAAPRPVIAVQAEGVAPLGAQLVQGLPDPLLRIGQGVEHFLHESGHVFPRQVFHADIGDGLGGVALYGGDIALGHLYGLPRAVLVHIGQLRGSLQHAQRAAHALARCVGLLGHVDDGAPDAHRHGGGLDIQGLVRVQLPLHVHQQRALRQRQLHRAGLLFKGRPAVGVQRDDPVGIQADGGDAVFTGHQRFAAVEADVLHNKAGRAAGVQDLDIAFIVQQAHGARGIALREGRRAQGHGERQQGDQQTTNTALFHNLSLIPSARCASTGTRPAGMVPILYTSDRPHVEMHARQKT